MGWSLMPSAVGTDHLSRPLQAFWQGGMRLSSRDQGQEKGRGQAVKWPAQPPGGASEGMAEPLGFLSPLRAQAPSACSGEGRSLAVLSKGPQGPERHVSTLVPSDKSRPARGTPDVLIAGVCVTERGRDIHALAPAAQAACGPSLSPGHCGPAWHWPLPVVHQEAENTSPFKEKIC